MNNSILEEYAKKYKPEELTADGIPNIETQLREIKEADEKQEIDKVNHNREMLQRVKCLALNKMGKDIFINTYNLNDRERNKLQETMHTFNDIPQTDIIFQFNEMITDILFDNKNIDLSKIPIYTFNK
jgi:hypothetical protein